MPFSLRLRAPLKPFSFALFAGILLAFAPPAARAGSVTFGFAAANSATQSFFDDEGENDARVSFTLTGGSGNTGLTLGAAKTIHVGVGELSGDVGSVGDGADFDGESLPHTFSLTGTVGTITQTLPQIDDLSSNYDDSSSSRESDQSVDIHAGPTVTFDMGTQGRVDVTPQEYSYDNTTGAAPPKFAYSLLLRSPAVPPSGITTTPSSVTYPASATGTVTLAKPAADTEIVILTSSNPSAASVPANITFAAGHQTATFPITTARVDSDTSVTLSAKAGGTTKTTTFTVKTRPETAFTYSLPGLPNTTYSDPNSDAQFYFGLTGGSGTVKLAQGFPLTITVGAYSHDYNIDTTDDFGSIGPLALSPTCTVSGMTQSFSQTLNMSANSDDFADQSFDASVTAGPTLVYDFGAKGMLQVTSSGFSYSFSNDGAQGFSGTSPANYTFLLMPPNTLSSLVVSPTKVYGGATTYGKVTLANVAPPGGQTVSLATSDASAANVPTSVVVPAGVKSAVFPITTATTDEDTPVTITAIAGGKSLTASLTVLSRYEFSGTVKSGSSGLSGVTVNASSTGSFTLTSTATPAASIPDNSATGLSTTISPKGTGTITGLVVGIDITHPNIGDLRVTLKGPDGTSAVLYNLSGGNQQNILASYPVLRTPVDSLSAFNGKQVAGTWTLLVQDLASGNVGTLNGWNLTFTYNGTVTGSGTTVSNGTYTVSNLKEGTYTATPVKSGTSFTPSSRSVSVGPNVADPNPTGIDFAKK